MTAQEAGVPRSEAGHRDVGAGAIVVLFNRDLRVHDHPALAEACRTADVVVPLFVFDSGLSRATSASANRHAFLLESLADLRRSLVQRGGQLYVREGDVVAEALRVARQVDATALFSAHDSSPYASDRLRRLEKACERERIQLAMAGGPEVIAPESLTPTSGDHYRVFTPYWRRWRSAVRRPVRKPPRRMSSPASLGPGRLPRVQAVTRLPASPGRPEGGETRARRLARDWLAHHLAAYPTTHDDLAADRTSRLSPSLHFGCLSANELAQWTIGRGDGEAFLRQLCWRDFHHQVLNAYPALSRQDYRNRRIQWVHDPDRLEAWKQGRTGVPIVDAAMRQLLAEGWMHNRARLLAASYLTRTLGIDWRDGAAHFMEWLVDADVANNSGNWQWVAGTGNDTRPNRRFNLDRQARRHDPDGEYVRRYVPELSHLPAPSVHRVPY